MYNLDSDQEEMVYQWAKKKDTPYAQTRFSEKFYSRFCQNPRIQNLKNISYEDIDFSECLQSS